MGMRENLITDWKDKTLEFQGKKLYVVDQFEYEGITYLYTVDIATINNKNIEVAFLYKVKDDIFEDVTDDALFNKLVVRAGSNLMGNMLKEDLEQLKKYGK